MNNLTLQPIIRARHHALKLLESLASSFGLRPDAVKSAVDATWDLYWTACFSPGSATDGLVHFVRGFRNVLAALDYDPSAAPQQATAG